MEGKMIFLSILILVCFISFSESTNITLGDYFIFEHSLITNSYATKGSAIFHNNKSVLEKLLKNYNLTSSTSIYETHTEKFFSDYYFYLPNILSFYQIFNQKQLIESNEIFSVWYISFVNKVIRI